MLQILVSYPKMSNHSYIKITRALKARQSSTKKAVDIKLAKCAGRAPWKQRVCLRVHTRAIIFIIIMHLYITLL